MAIRFASIQTKEVRLQSAQHGKASSTLEKATGNLLAHVPGEASGFYLMSAEAFHNPSQTVLLLLFSMSLVLLILVRWLASASLSVIVTSLLAFVIWMFVLEDGVFRAIFPDLLPDPLPLIFAAFFSAVVTILATAGKIK